MSEQRTLEGTGKLVNATNEYEVEFDFFVGNRDKKRPSFRGAVRPLGDVVLAEGEYELHTNDGRSFRVNYDGTVWTILKATPSRRLP